MRPVRLRSPGAIRAGFSLVEVLIVVALMATIAGAYVSFGQPSCSTRLQVTADTLAADLERSQETAISRGSPHRLTFEGVERRFILRHSGTNADFDDLPSYARTRSSEDADEATYALADRSPYGRYVRIAAFEPEDLYEDDEFELEFAADGSLTDGRTATIWLSAVDGGTLRYLPVRIYAATGVASIGTMTAVLPASAAEVTEE